MVLIAIPCLLVGGTEMQTLRLVEALVANGYQCVTVCYFEYDRAMVQRFELAGSEVVCLSAYGTRPAGNIATYRYLSDGLRRVVAYYRPTVAHVQYMAPGAMPIVILRRLGIRKIIATLHTDASIYNDLKLLRFLQRHVATVFTCVTEVAERSFFGSSNLFDGSYQIKPHDHITIHNSLPRGLSGNSPKNADCRQPITIGIVARLEEIKGVDLVIPAFRKVLEGHPDSRLVIVGDGKMRPMMEEQQRQAGIGGERIEWTGRVAHGRLAELYRRMDLVWVPSRSEGFGLSAIEAMAQGCAVVAAAVGGLTEVVRHDVDGLLFRPGDADDMAEKTLSLTNNPERLQEMRRRATESANKYSFENYSSKIKSLYSQLKP